MFVLFSVACFHCCTFDSISIGGAILRLICAESNKYGDQFSSAMWSSHELIVKIRLEKERPTIAISHTHTHTFFPDTML